MIHSLSIRKSSRQVGGCAQHVCVRKGNLIHQGSRDFGRTVGAQINLFFKSSKIRKHLGAQGVRNKESVVHSSYTILWHCMYGEFIWKLHTSMQELYPVYKNSISGSENKVWKSQEKSFCNRKDKGEGFCPHTHAHLNQKLCNGNLLIWFNSHESPYKIHYIFKNYPTAF